MEMRDELRSSVGAQDMDTSGYKVSDLDDFEFRWENDRFDVDAVFRTGTDTAFSLTTFDDLEMGGSAGNPILLDKEEDKDNSLPTTPVSEWPTRPPALLRNRSIGKRIENVSDHVFRNLLQ